MLRRSWKPLSATVFGVGGPAYLYYVYSKPVAQTFELAVKERSPDGRRTMSTLQLPLLSMEDVNTRLTENAVIKTTRRPGGIIWNRTTASLSSNDPIEDTSASAIVERDPSDQSAGDLLFFAVMDGHSGPHTSRLLSKVLLPAVATELKSLIQEPDFVVGKRSLLQRAQSLMWPSFGARTSLDADPEYFSLAIQSAFTRLDTELSTAPLKLLASELEAANVEKDVMLDLSNHPKALATMEPALSGADHIFHL